MKRLDMSYDFAECGEFVFSMECAFEADEVNAYFDEVEEGAREYGDRSTLVQTYYERDLALEYVRRGYTAHDALVEAERAYYAL